MHATRSDVHGYMYGCQVGSETLSANNCQLLFCLQTGSSLPSSHSLRYLQITVCSKIMPPNQSRKKQLSGRKHSKTHENTCGTNIGNNAAITPPRTNWNESAFSLFTLLVALARLATVRAGAKAFRQNQVKSTKLERLPKNLYLIAN